MKALVSIRIVTYNQEKFIKRCIDSVLAQKTQYSFDIIVGDDCSTDGTSQILQDYKINNPDNFFLFRHEKNIGAAANAEFTFNKCNGKYFCYMMGDDYWVDPFKLEKQVSFLENNLDYGLVYSDAIIVDEDENILKESYNKNFLDKINDEENFYKHLMGHNYIMTCSVCARYELLEKYDDYKLFKKLNFLMYDYPRWLNILRHTKFHYINEICVAYRVLNESSSHSPDIRKNYLFDDSVNHVRRYFIETFNNEIDAVSKHYLMFHLYNTRVKYGFLLRDSVLAREAFYQIKKNYSKFLLKRHYLFFFGSKNMFFYLIVKLLFKINGTIIKYGEHKL